MRKLLLIAVAVMGLCVAAQAQPNIDWGQLKRYAQSNEEFKLKDASKRRAVFIGNSITDNWLRFCPSFFDENGYVGRGISGQTSFMFLVRFLEDVVELSPKVVVINVGTNDVAENSYPYNEDRTMGNIRMMVASAKEFGIIPILSSVLPAAGFGWNKSITDSKEKIVALNERIKALAKEKGLEYIDYYSALVDETGALNPAYSNDGVHPTVPGYEIMQPLAKEVVEKILKTVE